VTTPQTGIASTRVSGCPVKPSAIKPLLDESGCVISCLAPRENQMSVINRRIKHWLARLEIKVAATHWADRHAAHHRNTLRAIVEICEAIRERLSLMGFDPALAVSLLRGEQAAAELAAIPDTEALRAADAVITRGDHNDTGGASSIITPQAARMAADLRDRSEPDLAHASLAELFAFCFPQENCPEVFFVGFSGQ
jgi:hypothetical protein